MVRKRYIEEQIIAVLNEAEAGARSHLCLSMAFGIELGLVGWATLNPSKTVQLSQLYHYDSS